MVRKLAAFALIAATVPTPALAQLPEPVRAIIDAAIATGEEAKVRTVIDLARQTNPDDTAEIDAILAAYETELAAAEEAKAVAEEEDIRTAGLFDNWSGKGELGAFNSTGNSSNTGVTAALSLTREGIDWTHKLRGRADFQRSNGVTTREQYSFAYEPNYNLSERLFLFGLGQFERDSFQGFSARYSISVGAGYQVIDKEHIQLALKAGPAFRITEFTTGETENRVGGLIGLDFDWDITDRLKLTQEANAVAETGGTATLIVDSSNTSLNLVTGLNAQISNNLSARLSYTVEYDSNPPAGAEQTDTLSRVTIIYDF